MKLRRELKQEVLKSFLLIILQSIFFALNLFEIFKIQRNFFPM